MATDKTVNYTQEQTAKVIADYVAGVTTEAIAAELGKSVRSIVAKLSREGVYKKAERVSKITGEKPVTKEALVADLALMAGLDEAEAASMTKASKSAILKLMALAAKPE